MKGKTLKYIIFLATISISGVLLIQFVFLKNSYKYSEEQFRESVTVALKEVAWQIMLETGSTSNYDSITPVEIISNNTYIVNVDALFDKEMVKKHLIEELQKHEIYSEFEFAIYNPETEQMDEKTFITEGLKEKPSTYDFPENKNFTYYFSIHFPDRSSYFNAQLSVWYFFTILLLVVVLFFGYTLSVIIRQRQLSEIQKNFINNLTHELKTPISSIGLASNVINDKEILKTPKRLFEYARIIQEQNNRLSANVEKVLNLASLEKNRIRLNLEDIDLESLILETTEHFKKSDNGRKANIDANLHPSNVIVKADTFHFQNLILNILENAVKYCDRNPVIQIEIRKQKNRVKLSFTDNGIGISKEHRKKVFKKFYRVPTGNVHNVKGFGLGLDYVHKIIKAHGWKIQIDENPEGGSIFTLTIPIKK
ncbi:MAG TPA: HAMP domain-containing sensor histidine kinase [Draconibacterium sp.]|nr:HAMP domain-containing sensor histidine kinase [Draconibacterium sp.]